MNVRTQDGVLTSLKWWAQMRVEGDAIVVTDVRTVPNEDEEIDPEVLANAQSMDLARIGEPEAIQALFKDINEGIRYQRDIFDVVNWIVERKSA